MTAQRTHVVKAVEAQARRAEESRMAAQAEKQEAKARRTEERHAKREAFRRESAAREVEEQSRREEIAQRRAAQESERRCALSNSQLPTSSPSVHTDALFRSRHVSWQR